MTPEGWEQTILGEIASIERGKFSHRPRNDPRFFGGQYPFVQTGDVAACGGLITKFSQTLNEEGLAVSRLFPAGTIVITIAANIGDTGIAQFPVAFPDSLVGIQAGPRVDCRYLEFSLRSRKKALEEAAPQNAQKNINLETLRPLAIPLPPLPEQRKIAAILSSVDEAIEGTQAVIDQLQVVKKAMMADLLTRGIPGRHKTFKQTEIGEVPEEWSLCSVEALGLEGQPTVRTGPFGSSMKTKDFRASGVPVLTIQSLGEGEILHDGLFYVSDAKATELAEYKVALNDVVFSRVADIGRCAAIRASEEGWLISPNLTRIRLDPKKADARFLMYLITLGEGVRRQVEMVTGSAGRPVISSTTLKTLGLTMPDLDEQRAIATVGMQLEDRMAVERASLEQLRRAKSALMSVLLTGEIRVRVDEESVA
jgi:type I restriction enzyme, S subunit